MAKKDGAAGGDNVVQMTATNCCVDKCGKKSDKMNFCTEHYMWFKEGLISKKGQRPTDFDKKYQAFMHRQKSAA